MSRDHYTACGATRGIENDATRESHISADHIVLHSLNFPAADWTTRLGIVALAPLAPLLYAHAMEVMAALLRHVRVEKW